MTRPPPRPPLFPYPPLSRSELALQGGSRHSAQPLRLDAGDLRQASRPHARDGRRGGERPELLALDAECLEGQELWRSEEHTSELQSRLHLVCRLLLEKKKKT